jgi:NADH dehydrogenase
MQAGRHAADNIKRQLKGEKPVEWKYFDKGSMATIGRHKAVAHVAGLKLSGHVAWLAWVFVHLMFLIDFRSRVFAFFEWAWSHFNYGKGARLITGSTGSIGKWGVLKEKDSG